MLVIADRGLHDDAPPSSWPALDAAVRFGADGVYAPLRTCSDGRGVLWTHETADEAVERMPFSRLGAFQGAEWALAEEAVDAYPDLHWILAVEAPRALLAAQSLARRFGRRRLLLFVSTNADILDALGSTSGVRTGLVFSSDRRSDVPPYRFSTSAPSVIVWDQDSVCPQSLERAARRGYRSLVRGDDFASEGMHLDGVITNSPWSLRSGRSDVTALVTH